MRIVRPKSLGSKIHFVLDGSFLLALIVLVGVPLLAEDTGLLPGDSVDKLQVADGLVVELLDAEPAVEQPAFLNFDESGRMWVMQYRQYPTPAGLEIVSRDDYWRNVYDKKPLYPGHPDYVSGADRITIHEDTDGDGNFDSVKTFLDGLNLATSFAHDRNGLWVLNPPYLLFYADSDGDDIPDGDPEVHLDGFGIEDSHAVVNSLCWGPDGWLYGAQGSTVSSNVTVVGSDDPPVSRIGQLMWRYHPTERRYEVFAEGGGNIWSCEFDSKGRLFAGNNGKTPGFFYLQGAYYRKWFEKHGGLSNPHTYGYFEGIDVPGFKRISNTIIQYESGALPDRYDGSMLYLNPLTRVIGSLDLKLDDLNFKGDFIDLLMTSDDTWHKPVYADVGPDGAVYVCDWYDRQVNHYRNHEGEISKLDGRLLRLKAKGAAVLPPFDLNETSTPELVDLLNHGNRWWRETARTVLSQRSDNHSVAQRLKTILLNEKGQYALEAFWALNLTVGIDRIFFDR